jgi:hypothetical protein
MVITPGQLPLMVTVGSAHAVEAAKTPNTLKNFQLMVTPEILEAQLPKSVP